MRGGNEMVAEKIIYGKIFTADSENSIAEGFAVAGGKIIAVGTKKQMDSYKGPSTKVIRYDAGLITPGFTEGHAHISQTMELLVGPLVNGTSIEKCQKQVADYARKHHGNEPILGTGFDPGLFGPAGPDKHYLDEVCSNRPVVIHDSGHHSVWVNSKALEVCGITRDTPDPENGHIVKDEKTGEPTGFVQEQAVSLMKPAMPEIGVEDYKKGILEYQKIALSYGVTNAFEPMLSYWHHEEAICEAYRQLEAEKRLKLSYRVALTLLPVMDPKVFFDRLENLHREFSGHDKLQFNTVKFFMDGVVDGHTAYLREPYEKPPLDCGTPNYDQEELNKRVTMALERGYRTHFHAIGDAATDEAINACEAAQDYVEGDDFRNQITHLQVCHEDQAERMADLGIIAVVNPYWHFKTDLYAPLEFPFLGKKRAEHMYYLGTYLKHGITISQASDFPVTIPPDTMDSLHMMVNREDPKYSEEPYFPSECISVEDALRVLTINGAFQLDLEDRKGSIEPGKDADFVWLSQDVTSIPKKDIWKTKILETDIGGKEVFERNEKNLLSDIA